MMLSEKMYAVLSCFPRDYSEIKYEKLVEKCTLNREQVNLCLMETLFPNWNYVRSSNGFRDGSCLTLTESGLAEIEHYEESKREQEIVKNSLLVAKIAMWVSIASAITAVASFIKMFF